MDDCNISLMARTGFRFHVCPATPADVGTTTDFLIPVTREDLRFRLFTSMGVVGASQFAARTHVNYHPTANLVALTVDGWIDHHGDRDTRLLRRVRSRRSGDVAIAIHLEHKHKDGGRELVAPVARYAGQIRVHTLESIESRDNHDATQLERNIGFTAETYRAKARPVFVRRKLDRNPEPGDASPATLEA